MKMLPRVMLVSLAALVPATALAYTVKAPLAGKVGDTTYASTGAFHGAVDVSGGVCAETGVTTAIVGSLSWNVTAPTLTRECALDATSGQSNEAKHTFANGYTFRQWHFNSSAGSYDRTCDRCVIGTVGATGTADGRPHAHLQYDYQGTKVTSWYSSYVTKGESVTTSTTVGSF